jgi:hypothetical protein
MRRRRWLLWGAVLALPILAAAVLVRGFLVSRAEGRAVADVQSLGGKVIRDKWGTPSDPVVIVDLKGTDATDATLEHLAALTQLKSLDLDKTKVTDAGLEHLAGLENLERLHLQCTRVTDAGLKELVRLQQLQELDIAGTRVTSAALKELAGLQQLRILGIDDQQCGDFSLVQVAPGLRNSRAPEGLQNVASLKQLRALYVWRSREGRRRNVTGFGGELMVWLHENLPGCRPAGGDLDD